MPQDIAVTARHLLKRGLAQRVLVVDLDVHQVCPTATLTQAMLGSD